MESTSTGRQSALLRFQGSFILPLARLTFLVGAGIAVVGCLIALAVALFFQIKGMAEPVMVPVPAERTVPQSAANLNQIDHRLTPPSGIHVQVLGGGHFDTLDGETVVALLQATTPNGLSEYPDDFTILGGESAHLFRRAPYPGDRKRSSLVPTEALIELFESTVTFLPDSQSKETISFHLKIAARDLFGSFSTPTDVSFSLSFSAASAQQPQETASPSKAIPAPKQTVRQLSQLEQLAESIALLIDPERSTQFEQTRLRALQVPKLCNTNEHTGGFITDFQRAFEHAKGKLTPVNIDAFYLGFCESWRAAVQERQSVQSKVDAARRSAINRNQDLNRSHELERIALWVVRNKALMLAVGAFSVFLVIALSLAVLASENHSKVMRELTEAARRLEASGTFQRESTPESTNKEA